jgi:hypothetical protein
MAVWSIQIWRIWRLFNGFHQSIGNFQRLGNMNVKMHITKIQNANYFFCITNLFINTPTVQPWFSDPYIMLSSAPLKQHCWTEISVVPVLKQHWPTIMCWSDMLPIACFICELCCITTVFLYDLYYQIQLAIYQHYKIIHFDNKLLNNSMWKELIFQIILFVSEYEKVFLNLIINLVPF